MKLENINPAKKNTHVTVNGNMYWVGHGGFIDDGEGEPLDVPETDAAKLTQGRAWKELSWDPKDPKYAKRMMPVPEGIGIGRRPRTIEEMKWDQGVRPKTVEELGGQTVTIPTKDGKPTGEEAVETAPPTPEELEKAEKAQTGLLSDSGADAVSADTTREIEALSGSNGAEEPDNSSTVVESGSEWPDPTEDMDIEYLREMAGAYDVTFHHRAGKPRLIKDIMAAMYSEE